MSHELWGEKPPEGPLSPSTDQQEKVEAAIVRLESLGNGNKSWAKHAATAQQSYDLREDAKAIDTLLTAFAAEREENERLKVENVNLRIAFDMADESRETFFRQAKAAEAKITAQAETISELVRALKDAKSYGNLYYRQRLPNQNEAYCDAVDRINALIAKTAPDTGEQSQ